MANSIKGTNIAAPIAPFTDADKYPTHSSIYGKGGYKSVKTLSELNSIPSERLEKGCVCYVTDNDAEYRFDGSKWVKECISESEIIELFDSGNIQTSDNFELVSSDGFIINT